MSKHDRPYPKLSDLFYQVVGGETCDPFDTLKLQHLRNRLPWWPLHPIGYPISMVWLMDQLWFSIFLAWLFKLVIIKYGGPAFYARARPFYLGRIAGPVVTAAIWLVIDSFTGMTDNVVFWI